MQGGWVAKLLVRLLATATLAKKWIQKKFDATFAVQ
jgi:hypothetical protein